MPPQPSIAPNGTDPPTRIPRLAIASFFLSLSSLIIGPLGFVPGILCGHLSRHRTARNPSLEDPGFARTGLVLGYLFYGLTLLALALALLYHFFIAPSKALLSPAEVSEIEDDLDTLEIYLERYYGHTGSYPTTAHQLEALYERPTIEPIPPNWKHTLPSQYTIDPWDNPYRYRCPGIRNPKSYDLWSLGPDGEVGTEDDITAR